jgi:hypothetical protein
LLSLSIDTLIHQHERLAYRVSRLLRIGGAALVAALLFFANANAQCPFNIASASVAAGTTDAVVLARYARAVRGNPLTANTGSTSTASNAAIAIVARDRAFDVTGNRVVDALDALIVARYLTGFRQPALTAGLSLAGEPRNGDQIQSFIARGCPDEPATQEINPFTFAGTGVVHKLGSGSGEIIRTSIAGLQCGDTIAVQAGTYAGISLRTISGCPGNPIIITNEGGKVIVNNWGIGFGNVKHAIVRSATQGTYGFEVQGFTGNPRYATAVSINESSADIDISGIHANTRGYGFAVKTDPSCSQLAYVSPARIDNIRIHHNLIENTFYEGMYLGYYLAGDVNLVCNGTAVTVRAERLSRMRIYNNILNNTGNDGIKLRLCLDGCDITDNTITGYGVLANPPEPQNASFCFGITVGSETYGRILRNTVSRGYCSGMDIRSNATGVIEIANNSTSYAGIRPDNSLGPTWASGILFNILSPWQQFYVHDNASSNHRSVDLEFTNYSSHPYVGSECRNGALLRYSSEMTTPVPKC